MEGAAHVNIDVGECVLAHSKQCCALAGVQARVGLVRMWRREDGEQPGCLVAVPWHPCPCRQGHMAAPAWHHSARLFFQQFNLSIARTACWRAGKGDFCKVTNRVLCLGTLVLLNLLFIPFVY